MKTTQLEGQLAALPAYPGVYLFRDEQDRVIYVGKAANLSNRVKSYFAAPHNLPSKVQRMVSRITALEFMVTNSEQEALILECNMIKKYHPRYNVSLKDDKTFPYLKIAVNEDWPSVYITRRLRKDGARYFGPFASAGSVRKTLKLIKGIFPFRSCTKFINGSGKRPCLEYYIHRCLGPCVGAVSKEEYREVINQVILFLDGRQELVLHELNRKLNEAVQKLEFEKAALIRDQIRAVENVIEGQKSAVALRGEQDVIALAQNEGQAYVEIFFIRNGKLIGRDHFAMEGVSHEEPGQIMTSFVKQYYASASYIPSSILLQYPVEEQPVLTRWLGNRKGSRVRLQVPQRGSKKQLINMVARNASEGLQLARAGNVDEEALASSLRELQSRLGLPRLPERIEGYDISDIQGALAVGSMVVFENGLPETACYRRFQIRTVPGADDYAMMQEMLRRRFRRAAIASGTRGEMESQKDGWSVMPDLILIDGGKGHLNAALEAGHEMGIDSIPIASLAKENEEFFLPGRSEPVVMPGDSAALHILQRVRDEAHRFAVSYHRKLRSKQGMASVLDEVPGIGPRRKQALLKKFGSVHALRDASPEEIGQVKGVSLALAEKIKEYL